MIPQEILNLIPTDPAEAEKWWDENSRIEDVVPPMEVVGISPDEPIRRFIDLPKLLDLLSSKRLFLPQLRQHAVGDPFECCAGLVGEIMSRAELERRAMDLKILVPANQMQWIKINARRPDLPTGLGTIAEAVFQRYNDRYEPYIRDLEIEKLRQVVWFLERQRLESELAFNCWFRGKNESDAMWRIYSKDLGVAISSTPSRLQSSIKYCLVPKMYKPMVKLTLAAVEYCDDEGGGETCPWLVKREAYKHENEARFYSEGPWVSPVGLALKVNLSLLIEEIVITPFAKKWQASAIEETITALLSPRKPQFARAEQIAVRQSQHMTGPRIEWPSGNQGDGKDPA